jgi:hypothetical protein
MIFAIKKTRGALFEVIRKVACAQISNMRMVLRISLSDRSQYHSNVADLRTRNFANDFKSKNIPRQEGTSPC